MLAVGWMGVGVTWLFWCPGLRQGGGLGWGGAVVGGLLWDSEAAALARGCSCSSWISPSAPTGRPSTCSSPVLQTVTVVTCRDLNWTAWWTCDWTVLPRWLLCGVSAAFVLTALCPDSVSQSALPQHYWDSHDGLIVINERWAVPAVTVFMTDRVGRDSFMAVSLYSHS